MGVLTLVFQGSWAEDLFGFTGLTVAVLFDVVVLRILILPAAMTLLGERCWWPTRVTRQNQDNSGWSLIAAVR